MASGRQFKIKKSRCVKTHLTIFNEIWYSKAYWLYKPQNFKNPRWRTATILKNGDISMTVWFLRNIAWWCMSVHWTPSTNLHNSVDYLVITEFFHADKWSETSVYYHAVALQLVLSTIILLSVSHNWLSWLSMYFSLHDKQFALTFCLDILYVVVLCIM